MKTSHPFLHGRQSVLYRSRNALWLGLLCAFAALTSVHAAEWRASTPAEQALDAAAFAPVEAALQQQFSDVQSAVIVQRGRVVFEYYRDGAPGQLRDVQSVAKSALSTLVGIALGQGRIASLDQAVVALLPEWTALNPDPRAQAITVRHLLTMSTGFEVNDPRGTAAAGNATTAWARPLGHAPGESFAYDNAVMPLLAALLEKVAGMPLADYAHTQLVQPLGMSAPAYARGLHLRTVDMARLGHLLLNAGAWDGQQIVPAAYASAATQRQNAGGPPVAMPYGYLWWIVPSRGPGKVFMASGYGGQLIWAHEALELVVAVTATASPDSQRRGHTVQLLQNKIVPAASQRAAASPP